jgi:hypothetical protein
MAMGGEIVNRASSNVRARVDSVTKNLPDDFRSRGAVGAVLGLAERFARNNRALIRR